MFKYLLLSISSAMLISCASQNKKYAEQENLPISQDAVVNDLIQNMTGTVVLNELEGGFWGIITTNQKKYEPIVLPDQFKVDGISVKFNAKEIKDKGSIYMWGTIIEIIDIERLD